MKDFTPHINPNRACNVAAGGGILPTFGALPDAGVETCFLWANNRPDCPLLEVGFLLAFVRALFP